MEEQFKTSDFVLAATLALRFKVLSLESIINNDRKKEFVFENSKELQGVVEEFWEGSLLVEPKAFANQQHTLKAMLYGRK